MRRAVAAALLLATSCTSAPAPAPGPILTRWDGRYYGSAVANGNGVECNSGSTPLRITVESGRAWIGPRHRRHQLEGTVNAGGQIILQDYSGGRILRGIISGDQLSAVEQLPLRQNFSASTPGLTPTCMAVVRATRLTGGPASDTPAGDAPAGDTQAD